MNVHAYQDHDPLGKGQWFSYVSNDEGHIIANLGPFDTDNEAAAAGVAHANSLLPKTQLWVKSPAFAVGDAVIWIGSYGDPHIPGTVVELLDPNHPEAIHGTVKIVTGNHNRPSWCHPEELRKA